MGAKSLIVLIGRRLVMLLLAISLLQGAPAFAQTLLLDDVVPGIVSQAPLPSGGAGGGALYELIAAADAAAFDPTGGNSQLIFQRGVRNSSAQFISGALDRTASYQVGAGNAGLNAAVGTYASSIDTIQYGSGNDVAALILGGSRNRVEALQAGNANTGRILLYGTNNTNVGLVQAGDRLTRSIAVVGGGGVNVLVMQK